MTVLLTRNPNNAALDAQLRSYRIEPSRIPNFELIEPNTIPTSFWEVRSSSSSFEFRASGVIGRPRVMRYSYGPPVALSTAVANATSNPITRTLSGSETVGTSTSMSISSTVQSSFFRTVEVSVTASFSQTWTSEHTMSDTLEVIIPPGMVMWLQGQAVMRTVDADYVVFDHGRLQNPLFPEQVWRHMEGHFRGTVTAPGREGNLTDYIVAQEAPIPRGMADSLRSASPSGPESDGVLELPGLTAALLLADSAEGTGD
ncbi:hypothetical protein [Actinomadura harenae]|nr:hypothetical protein [Actinomadura harenae]